MKFLIANEQATLTSLGAANETKMVPVDSILCIQTYNDMHGNFRVKSETLVASSSITGDAADDAKFPDS